MKDIKTRDLRLFPMDKTGYDSNESEVFKVHYGTPKRSLTTIRLRANLRGFRINVSVVCPQPEKRKGSVTLTRGQADCVTQAIHDLVEALIKQALGEDALT